MISKKKIKEIEFVEVYSEVIRDYRWSSVGDKKDFCFLDNPIDEWTTEEKEIFNIASETEDRIKKEILKILMKGK